MFILNFLEAIIAILLSFTILLQQRASGLSQSMGGTGTTYVQRRGPEKLLFRLTIILSCLFFGIAILQWYVPR